MNPIDAIIVNEIGNQIKKLTLQQQADYKECIDEIEEMIVAYGIPAQLAIATIYHQMKG